MARSDTGLCASCGERFEYQLIHNGFNDTAFAYCDTCGMSTLLSCWYDHIPPEARLKVHGPVNPEVERLLEPCACGGTFRAAASPRCPHCRVTLSAEASRAFIEAAAPGTAKGWRWQGTWDGVYSIIIGGKYAKDNWKSPNNALERERGR